MRRLLPAYLPDLHTARRYVRERDHAAHQRALLVQTILEVMPASSSQEDSSNATTVVDLHTPDPVRARVTIDTCGSSVALHLRQLPAEDFLRILKILAGPGSS